MMIKVNLKVKVLAIVIVIVIQVLIKAIKMVKIISILNMKIKEIYLKSKIQKLFTILKI